MIFLDMDDVLVNFSQGYKNVSGLFPWETITPEERKIGKQHNNMSDPRAIRFWKPVIEERNFWLNLDWMADGRLLWKFFKRYRPVILTIPGQPLDVCKRQKTEWLHRNIGATYTIIFSDKKHELVSCDTDLLIDDSKQNVEAWCEAGGQAILHVNAMDTIYEFLKMESYHV